ncbi:translocase of inner membrane 8 [Brevipalpus obovatus]|uniref:translocase of inner membrane 8 n=1 Tax=Brevipalpus obovatus TaxID=246614 RepID=UPI003D9F71B9
MSLDLSDISDPSLGDKELQHFLIQEQQKAQFQAQVHKLTDACWEKCVVDKPSSKLDGKTETCITNCVDRFIDASLAITQRFSAVISKQVGN